MTYTAQRMGLTRLATPVHLPRTRWQYRRLQFERSHLFWQIVFSDGSKHLMCECHSQDSQKPQAETALVSEERLLGVRQVDDGIG